MKKTSYFLSLFFCAVIASAVASEKEINLSPFSSEPLKVSLPASIKGKWDENLNSRVGFEKNKGQWPGQVEYKADLGSGRRVFFEKNKFTYVVYNQDEVYRVHEDEHHRANTGEDLINTHAFEMEFVNSNAYAQVEGSDKNDFHYNYFIGNDPSKWASDVPVYKHLTYTNLYDGIDLIAYQRNQVFKYDYMVKAGVAAETIQLKFNGANKLEIKNKNLYIVTSVGDVVESIPYAYQLVDGREVKVECEYRLGSDGKTVSFYFPQGYDSRYELVIDPVLVASTFSGSTGTVYGHCATYDGSGNIYTGGRCFGVGYPVTVGASQLTFAGGVDISISKLNPTGSALIYATYLGGNSQDNPHSMFVNSSNELYVYGSTSSTNFPTAAGAYDITHNGLTDMIVCRLNPTGTTLLGSTYIGGTADDGINSATYNYGDAYRGEIVLNSAGDVFIVGTTKSTNFPATTGAYDVSHNGQQDAVVLKLNAALSTLQWATFLGGTGDDAGCSIRLNSTGDVYVVGLTSGGGFPVTTGAYTSTFQGGTYDGFVSRLNASGNALVNSTYIGTGGKDIVYFIDIDINNNIFIYGISEGTFPIVGMVYFNANSENILAKLNPSLSTVLFFTSLGNSTKTLFSPTALLVDLCGNIYMAGWGNNSNYPLTSTATQSTTTGNGFHVMVLGPNASSLLYGSYFGSGGDHVDGGTSRFDPNGFVYQAVCACGAFPTLPSAFSPSNNASSCDIAVFKLDFEINCNPLITNTIVCLGKTATISITNVNGLTNPSFSIQPGGQVSTTPFFTVAPQVTTTYTLFITGVNGFSAVVTNTGLSTVSIAPVPQISPSLTQAACSGTFNAFDIGLTFLPAGPTPTYNIFWSPVIPFGITTQTQTGSSGGINPGTYSVYVVAAHGCTNAANFTMDSIPSSVAFNLTGPYVINCYNPTLTVGASPPTYSYTWLGLSATYTGSTASFIQGNAGTWTVNATDLNSGCMGTRTVVITEDITTTSSTVSPMFQNITCSVTSIITVTVVSNPSVNVSHQWLTSAGGTLSTNGTPSYFTPGAPGTITCTTINDANGCSVSKTFSVTSSSGFPTFSVTSPQNYTLGCSSKSFAIINVVSAQTTPVPGGPVSYTLLGPASNTTYVTGPAAVYTVSIPGTWTVVTKDNTNLCESKLQISVIQNTFAPQLSANVPATRLTCYVPKVVLEGTSTTPNTSFLWAFPSGVGQLQGSTITVAASTVQTSSTLIATYTLTATDDNNTCKSSTVITMEQNMFPPNVIITGESGISCKTLSVTLTNQSTTNIPPFFTPSLPVVSQIWNGPSPQDPLQLVTTYVGYLPGTYTMVARDLNNGCTAVGTKSIDDLRNYPQIIRDELADTIDCGSKGKPIFPRISGSTANLSYNWTSVPGSTISSPGSNILTVTRSGQYNVVVTNTLNGCISSGFIEVVNGTLKAAFVADRISGYAPFPVSFTNMSTSSDGLTGMQNVNSFWNFGNGTTQSSSLHTTVLEPVVYKQPGTYTVTLFSKKGECFDTATVVIRVDIPSELVIPNIFTPNGDGKNDLFFVKAKNLDNIDIIIVDRWGKTVYELVSGTGNIEWDGKNMQGNDAAEGVYLYKLKASGRDGSTYDKQGNITLVR
jgi:gliding motility-associated-like protein